ncbi:MAG: hypothetical protein U0Y68_02115 [Blastocatellia bacterium]
MAATAPPVATEATKFARKLNLFDATMIVISGIIGTGIFINPYIVAQKVHTSFWILAEWIAGGILRWQERLSLRNSAP